MRKYNIELDEFDLGQVLDGLEARAVIRQKTVEFHRTGEADVVVEECRDELEAEKIAAHYRSIFSKIRGQREAQSLVMRTPKSYEMASASTSILSAKARSQS